LQGFYPWIKLKIPIFVRTNTSFMKSMTGYGKAVCELPGKKITFEMKSVNSKQLDFNIKLPAMLREKETEIRSLISKCLERGKVDLYVNVETLVAQDAFSLNTTLAAQYHEGIKQLSGELGLPMPSPQEIIPLLLRMPDVVKTPVEELKEEEWTMIHQGIEDAVYALDTFRLNEGAVLEKDILQHIDSIEKGIPRIELYEKERIQQIRQRIKNNLSEFFDPEKTDKNRFEQEMIYYLEKIDFTEEKVRLQKHCTYFRETISETASNGRKLGFITQEIGREINTLGSKANDSNIQKIVIGMKDELEKIREQLLNIL